MNPADDNTTGFDEQARRLHRASLAQLSPQTLMQLRGARHQARHAAPSARASHWRWLTATAFSAVLAVGVGLQFLPRQDNATPGPAPTMASAAAIDDIGTPTVFDEDPDLYLWLASVEAQPLSMESTP